MPVEEVDELEKRTGEELALAKVKAYARMQMVTARKKD